MRDIDKCKYLILKFLKRYGLCNVAETKAAIAKAVGCSEVTVNRAAHQLNIPISYETQDGKRAFFWGKLKNNAKKINLRKKRPVSARP